MAPLLEATPKGIKVNVVVVVIVFVVLVFFVSFAVIIFRCVLASL